MTILHNRFGRCLLVIGALQTYILLMVIAGGYSAVALVEAGKPSDPDKENRRIRITADKLVAELDVSEIEFIGNVRTTSDDAVITSDRLKIIYDPKRLKNESDTTQKESIEKIIANGNVRILTDNIIAETDRAEYSMKSEILVLQGEQSSVTQGGYSITGSKFTLRRTEGKLTVESSKEHRVKAILLP